MGCFWEWFLVGGLRGAGRGAPYRTITETICGSMGPLLGLSVGPLREPVRPLLGLSVSYGTITGKIGTEFLGFEIIG